MSSYNEESPAPKAESSSGQTSRMVFNILTIVALLASVCLCLFFLSIFVNPSMALNPFPPPTAIQPLQLPTATWTPQQLPATRTPTVTIEPSVTWTPQPSVTPGVVNTVAALPTETSRFTATSTPRPSATPRPTGAPFSASVVPIDSTIVHPEFGCNWWGVGGQASDLKGNPVRGLVIKLAGVLNNQQISMLTVTGTAPVYGQGGYEFKLGDVPQNTRRAMYVQLLDQAGLPLSEQVYFDTTADCAKNLILIRFKQER
jgi:hypothetical protein